LGIDANVKGIKIGYSMASLAFKRLLTVISPSIKNKTPLLEFEPDMLCCYWRQIFVKKKVLGRPKARYHFDPLVKQR
jgi:hypothetical protein